MRELPFHRVLKISKIILVSSTDHVLSIVWDNTTDNTYLYFSSWTILIPLSDQTKFIHNIPMLNNKHILLRHFLDSPRNSQLNFRTIQGTSTNIVGFLMHASSTQNGVT